jgi:hypothetical protein
MREWRWWKPYVLTVIAISLAIMVACDKFAETDIITDTTTGLQWMKNLSPREVSWEEAKKYCNTLKEAGYDDWRLPTKVELESTLNPAFNREDSKSKEQPFRRPFVTNLEGYIFSGTLVAGYEEAPWIMRLANGHIFNGKGYKAYAQCVRDTRFK